jgi:CheY-like chemotaxis protein
MDPVVLIVDDNDDNRFTLSMRLESCGYSNVVTAENGREALEKMRSGPVDLVLLDIMMPEMNGYEVLEHLKADTELRDLPVIVISALDEIDSVIKCIELGAEDYLSKPFNPTLLRARVGASLEKKRLRDEVRAGRDRLQHETRRGPDPPARHAAGHLSGVVRGTPGRGLCPDGAGARSRRRSVRLLLGLFAPVLLSGWRRLREGCAGRDVHGAGKKPGENGCRVFAQ